MALVDASFMPVAIALSLVDAWKNGAPLFFACGVTMVGAVVACKHAIGRTRPDGTPRSFPSGHSAVSAFVAICALRALPPWGFGACLGWAIAVAWSRVRLRRHYVTDVVAGFLIGALAASAVIMRPRWWRSSADPVPP